MTPSFVSVVKSVRHLEQAGVKYFPPLQILILQRPCMGWTVVFFDHEIDIFHSLLDHVACA